MWFTIFIFKLVDLIFYFFSRSLISSQSDMNGVFNIMSCPKTSCSGGSCRVVWYVLRAAKAVAANISDQGSSFSR